MHIRFLDRPRLLLALALIFAGCAGTSQNYSVILSHPARPDNERELDLARKPSEVMTFYEVKRGDKVVDLLAGRGYYTVILSQLVGAHGKIGRIASSGSHSPMSGPSWGRPTRSRFPKTGLWTSH